MHIVYYITPFRFITPTKSEGYSFGVVRASVRPFHPYVHTFCLYEILFQYLLVRFDSLLVLMISTIYSQYPTSFVDIDSLTLELLPFFSIGNYNAKPISFRV